MSKIYLARHGQDEDNAKGILNGRRDTPLTDIGIEQAKALAENIRQHDLEITKVYCSPLIRTWETAHIVTQALGWPGPEKLDCRVSAKNRLTVQHPSGTPHGLVNEW